MSKIHSITKQENYEVEITSRSGHKLIADEPEDLGGKNKGMSPDDLIVSALAACTSATVKMYVQRKGWDLKDIQTSIQMIKGESPKDLPRIHRTVKLIGDLTDEQRERIMEIANKCPIHRLLTSGVEIDTELEE